MDAQTFPVRDNPDRRRYELQVGDQIAVADYNLVSGGIMFTETVVPQALEGQGLASRLAHEALADARARGLQVLPVCPFLAGYIQRHPEVHDLVHPAYRAALGF